MVGRAEVEHADPEARLKALGIELPAAPTPLGSYHEAVQSGSLLFLSGILPVINHKAPYVGVLGKELDANAGREAAHLAALGALAAAKAYLGSLSRIKRVIRLGVFLAASAEFASLPAVADGASDLFRDLFGEENMAVRLVIGVATLPLHVPIELEVIFEMLA